MPDKRARMSPRPSQRGIPKDFTAKVTTTTFLFCRDLKEGEPAWELLRPQATSLWLVYRKAPHLSQDGNADVQGGARVSWRFRAMSGRDMNYFQVFVRIAVKFGLQ